MLKFPAAEIKIFPNYYVVKVPEKFLDAWTVTAEVLKNKHNCYAEVHIGKPRKPRTTGKGSQNNLVQVMIHQIEDYTGYDFNVLKYKYIIPAAVERGWPTEEGLDGELIGIHESKASTTDMKYLFLSICDIAVKVGCTLYDEYGEIVTHERFLA